MSLQPDSKPTTFDIGLRENFAPAEVFNRLEEKVRRHRGGTLEVSMDPDSGKITMEGPPLAVHQAIAQEAGVKTITDRKPLRFR